MIINSTNNKVFYVKCNKGQPVFYTVKVLLCSLSVSSMLYSSANSDNLKILYILDSKSFKFIHLSIFDFFFNKITKLLFCEYLMIIITVGNALKSQTKHKMKYLKIYNI